MISVVTRQLRGSGRLECNRLPKFRAKEHSQTLDSSLLREDEREGYGYETGFRVLPYLLQDSFTRDRRLVDVKTVVLENRHLRAEFWPQYGASEYSQARAPVRCRLSTGAEITLSTT